MEKNYHHPRKRFGQHFLIDHHIIDRIIASIDPRPGEHIVEIGPGLGALTQPLLQISKTLDVIEIDRNLLSTLKKMCAPIGSLNAYSADVVTFDFSQLVPRDGYNHKKLRLVGNLPYNIATTLIFALIQQRHLIEDMHFMLQKEVAERLTASPGTRTYGRPSVIAQYYFHTELLFHIKPAAFRPPPKVDSSFVRIIPHAKLPFLATNEQILTKIVTQAFNQRRKTLQNALKSYINKDQLIALNIDSTLRPEAISLAEYVKIANLLAADNMNKDIQK
jgi:16S rRNA (adenine1518-N6/adenine1519-N6)-dimethyltransferase